jgi:hypothetical protein
MVLYEILAKASEGTNVFGNKFLDFVDTMDDYISAMPEIFEQLSGLGFVMYILIPGYLAAPKIINDVRYDIFF